MSVRITHLNADSAFLLTFYIPTLGRSHGDFSILIDPWLWGDLVLNPFATTRHNISASISHLSEIPEPDLLLVSQPFPDHCHKGTLLQLRPESKTVIAAVPKAAAIIREWDHFNPVKVSEMPIYDPKRKRSISRFFTPPLTPMGEPGEVTLAYIPRKSDKTGYHNALGILYRPPTADRSLSWERPRPLSLIYSPHGVRTSDLSSYAENYLRPMAGLPLTLLLHSFSTVSMPWYLGGMKILYGVENGVDLARYLKPEVWIGAHDEEKEKEGLVIESVREVSSTVEEVGKLLCPDVQYQRPGYDDRIECLKWKNAGRWVCEIKDLAAGESMDVGIQGCESWLSGWAPDFDDDFSSLYSIATT